MAIDNSTIVSSTNSKYNHPYISSNISTSETIYTTSTGAQRMFTAFTSDKGVDNKAIIYTDPKEFIALTGQPNMKKHGQANYNIINWLESGGEVVGIRVLPDNAGYAHAMLNILLKKSVKKVLNSLTSTVDVENVFLKPAVSYSEVNNTSKELLTYELQKDRTSEDTIDGFSNNMLFAVHPNGRGEGYNDLGFRIYLNESYDDVYSFRVYNFEVIRFDEYGATNIIEGPFYVSLDPDALSGSNESMFIEDVINNYSNHLKVIYNEQAYLNIARMINPNVPPASLDILTGKTRFIKNESEKFYHPITKKFEDTHIALQRYDNAGNPLVDESGNILTNIIDANDVIEQTILVADNTFRTELYNRYKAQIEYMREIFNGLKANNFISLTDKLLKTEDGITQVDGDLVKAASNLVLYQNEIKNLVEVFNTSLLDSDFIKIVNKNTLVRSAIDEALKMAHKLISYNKIIQADSSIIEVEEMLNASFNKVNHMDILDIRAVSKKDKANALSLKILDLKSKGDINEQAEELVELLTDTKDLIDYLSVVTVENNLSTTQLEATINSYNYIIDKYSAIFDPMMTDDSIKALVIDIYNELDAAVASIYTQIEIVTVSLDLTIIEKVISEYLAKIISRLTAILYTNQQLYKEKISTNDGFNLLESTCRQTITNTSAIVTVMKSIIYTNQLQNFYSPVVIMNGTDGSLSSSNQNIANKTRIQLLSKAYEGLIDSDITSRKIIPFQYILDANYPIEVKNSIVRLTRDIRKDIFFYSDLGYQSNVENTIAYRSTSMNADTQFMGLFGQDYIVYDQFNGKDIRVTFTYFLSSRIPYHAEQFGMHYPMAGNRRGLVDGFKAVNFFPTEAQKEMLYNKQINYVETDPKRTRIGSQQTGTSLKSPLSNINNVLTVLDIKRNVEDLSEDYQFEFEDESTIKAFEYSLNEFLQTYITNRSVATINGTVYASEYDKQQGILRVQISVKFNGIIERIIINIDVVK